MVDSEAFGSSCSKVVSNFANPKCVLRGFDKPTARQLWSWLKVMKFSAGLDMAVERGARRALVAATRSEAGQRQASSSRELEDLGSLEGGWPSL